MHVIKKLRRPESPCQRKHPFVCVKLTLAKGSRNQAMAFEAVRLPAQVAEEGLELVVEFRGKTYILAAAGDSRGIISIEQP